MHEDDLEVAGRGAPARPAPPKTLRECVTGDRVRAWVDDGWVELVVTNTALCGSVWVRRLEPDGREGEFEAFHRDAPVEPVELR